MDKYIQQQQQQQQQQEDGFTVVSLDDSFIFYDYRVRRWFELIKRKTGCQSNRFTQTFMHFGAISMEGKQPFRH
ncbi:MAG TPA: hypothetical protein VN703_09755 [Candidatus Sulfopaludibacter sp.]|nr:hypothetical protein [Candidatus Sulfopaludibacter sp.]